VKHFLEHLPIRAATRTVLDYMTYTCALPEWTDVTVVDFEQREQAILRLASSYLRGRAPASPFVIDVPKRSGARKRWSLPSINDQILLQACIAMFAAQLEQLTIDRSHVFSYRRDRTGATFALVEDQISAWQAFQDETKGRCSADDCMLQIDFSSAFSNIRRDRLTKLMHDVAHDDDIVRLVDILITSMAAGTSGLPLVNDSIFFLGNSCLGDADQVISKHTSDFIRFVDDYRIFGRSKTVLEDLLRRIVPDLARAGFVVHMGKVKVGTGREYLDAIAGTKYAQTTTDYLVSAAVFTNMPQPALLADQVKRMLASPDDLLHEGFGRLLVGAVRRMRVNASIATIKNYPGSPLDVYRENLDTPRLSSRVAHLVRQYAPNHIEAWRATLLVYLSRDLTGKSLTRAFQFIRSSKDIPEVVRLWASNRCEVLFESPLRTTYAEYADIPSGQPLRDIEKMHGLSYLERGRMCIGGRRQ
jgi:hypothetical protein